MSQPTRGDVHVNRPLTNISVAFLQDQKVFMADKVFPILPVAKQGDLYYEYPRDAWFRDEAKERAPGTESAGGGYDVVTNPYFAKKFAFHKDIDDDVRANQDEALDSDRDATEFVSQKMLIKKERVFVDKYFKTALWTGSTTGTDIVPGTKWNAAGSDPVDDVEIQMDAMQEKTGFRPNTLVFSPQVHRALKNNASILDRFKHTQSAIMTEAILASLFGVDNYFVARATENTAKEGATRAMSFMFGGENCLLAYSQPSPGLMKPSAGYTFSWTGLLGAGALGNRIKRFRMEKLNSDRVEGEVAFDQKLVASDLGVFFDDTLA